VKEEEQEEQEESLFKANTVNEEDFEHDRSSSRTGCSVEKERESVCV